MEGEYAGPHWVRDEEVATASRQAGYVAGFLQALSEERSEGPLSLFILCQPIVWNLVYTHTEEVNTNPGASCMR